MIDFSMHRIVMTLAGYAMMTSFACADIRISFEESAPTDRFTIKNVGACEWEQLTLDIDLARSRGKLIFDTTPSGAGENVFQSFQVTKGRDVLSLSKPINDGDSRISLAISELKPDQQVSFTIDVDDTLVNSELRRTRIVGSEIANGTARISAESKDLGLGVFDDKNIALIELPVCAS